MKSNRAYGERKIQKINVEETLRQQAYATIEVLRKELFRLPEINVLVLFGSFARGDYSLRHSDIDLMIFLDKTERDAAVEERIRKKILQHSMGKNIGVHPLFQYRHLGEEDKSLMLTIAKEGKVLFARKTLVISQNILGPTPYYLLKFETAGCHQVTKNKLQRFLHGYRVKGKRFVGIIDGKKVIGAGKGAILIPEELRKKVLLFAQSIGVAASQQAKFYQ
ncbi:nucleotidyltransferase domain-containing protein [Candidatus Woesearchaeota archaeon]|nr:nucleotidyltransferase domain-containing protein [Candidatus Woesearchaeota archaeon]